MGLSDIILAATLLANAGAILNFKLLDGSEEFDFEEKDPSTWDKVRDFLRNLRYFRIFIAIWNVLVIIGMIVFFGS
eukprot:m.49664 g.49664  ORF g.49664 m.49664 type:complete len:76 (-) comp7463_c1_seq1:232-459(-)